MNSATSFSHFSYLTITMVLNTYATFSSCPSTTNLNIFSNITANKTKTQQRKTPKPNNTHPQPWNDTMSTATVSTWLATVNWKLLYTTDWGEKKRNSFRSLQNTATKRQPPYCSTYLHCLLARLFNDNYAKTCAHQKRKHAFIVLDQSKVCWI